MVNFFRSLCITICAALFNFIPSLYKLFYDLASNHDLFSSETIDTFSKNIYILVSVVMLFAFAVKAIESIINPDMLFDSKKGFTSVIKRSVIALVLIVAIPFGFDFFYKFQDEVMSKSLIEKLIIGVSVGENTNLAEESGAGQMLASSALASVLYPKDEDTCVEYEDSNVCMNYNNAIEDISKLYKLIPDINEKVGDGDEADYVLVYEGVGLLSILVGVVLIYMLVLFCIDTALRLIKMSFLELTAPISVVAYIFGGNDILKNWFKEVKGTAFSLFGRIAALALMVFVLSKLPEFVDNNFTGLEGKLINLLIIMATLMFVKEAPNMIEKIFGIKVGGKGGIAGRLGSMAGVGNIAKSAWEKVRNVGATVGMAGLGLAGAAVGATTSLAGLGFAGAAAGLGAGVGFAGKKISDVLKNTDTGQKIGRFGKSVASFASAGNPIKGTKEAIKTYKGSPVTAATKASKKAAKAESFANDIGVDYRTGSVKGTKDDKLKAQRATEALDNQVDKISGISTNQRNAIKEKISADRSKESLEKLKSHNDKIGEILDSTIANTKDPNTIRILSNLKSQYVGGKISLDDMTNRVTSMAGKEITEGDANQIIGKLNSINNMAKSNSEIGALINEDGGISGVNITTAVNKATNRASNAETIYKAQYDAASDKSKEELDIIDSNAKIISTEYAKEIGTSSSDKYQKVSISEGTVQTPSSDVDIDQLAMDALYEANMGAEEERRQRASSTSSGNSSTSSSSTSQSNNPGSSSPSGDGSSNTDSGSSSSSSQSNPSSNTNGSDNDYSNSSSGSSSSNGNNSGGNNGGENNSGSGNNSGGNSSNQDLASFFSGLSKDIKDASDATNSILNDQLKTQQSTLDESRKQNTTLNNISSGVNNLNNTVGEMNNNIKNFSNTNNKNLKDISQKLDDSSRDNNE